MRMYGIHWFWFCLVWLLPFVYSMPVDPRCEANRIPMCAGLYSSVIFPNKLNHQTQEQAYEEITKFWSLIHQKCSGHILHFLCRMYAPQCPYVLQDGSYQHEKTRRPCKESCWQVQRDCYHDIVNHGVYWPPELYCENLPDNDCIETPQVDIVPTDHVQTYTPPVPTRHWEPETEPPTTQPVWHPYQHQCPANEEYTCGTQCAPNCARREWLSPCSRDCAYGCYCKHGYMRNNNGHCVTPDQCDPIETPPPPPPSVWEEPTVPTTEEITTITTTEEVTTTTEATTTTPPPATEPETTTVQTEPMTTENLDESKTDDSGDGPLDMDKTTAVITDTEPAVITDTTSGSMLGITTTIVESDKTEIGSGEDPEITTQPPTPAVEPTTSIAENTTQTMASADQSVATDNLSSDTAAAVSASAAAVAEESPRNEAATGNGAKTINTRVEMIIYLASLSFIFHLAA